jgi:RHS repeat-associated protein
VAPLFTVISASLTRHGARAHYNYFRDYDPAIGRYVESDPIGLNGGINTYAYVAWPVRAVDRFGLTPADVQGVFRDVGASFSDLDPASTRIGFQPMKPGIDGVTNNWDGQIYIDPSWATKDCFTRREYENLFFTLFHESMHSTDSFWRRVTTSNSDNDVHHDSIYQREVYERMRMRPGGAPGNMWGKANDHEAIHVHQDWTSRGRRGRYRYMVARHPTGGLSKGTGRKGAAGLNCQRPPRLRGASWKVPNDRAGTHSARQ